MQLGMIGLGRMGGNMVRRLMRAGHQCVVYDVNPPAVQALASEGATGSDSLAAFAQSHSVSDPRRGVDSGSVLLGCVKHCHGYGERLPAILHPD